MMGSKLLSTAKALHREYAAWMAADDGTAEKHFDAMVRHRAKMHAQPPETALDAVLLLGVIRSLLSFNQVVFTQLDEDNAWTSTIASVNCEALAALNALRVKLESDAGTSMADLGLFQNEIPKIN